MKKQNGTKRNLFAELMEGVDAMKAHREGKVTLRTHTVAAPEIRVSPGAEFFVAVREKFNVSRAVWANMLRVSPRTVEKWEQGGQVSPLAATFVELVSTYPDTIKRLQTLPKRVARSRNEVSHASLSLRRRNNDKKVNATFNTNTLRAYFHPKKVRVLFVAEAPPAGGTFFYAANSQVYRYLREALQAHLGNPQDFLEAFKERGYFLDDLSLEPIDRISKKDRIQIFTQNVPSLAHRIAQYNPEVVVSILTRICPYVEDAISKAKISVPHHCVPFPGTGQQGNFRRKIAEIVPMLP